MDESIVYIIFSNFSNMGSLTPLFFSSCLSALLIGIGSVILFLKNREPGLSYALFSAQGMLRYYSLWFMNQASPL